MAVKVVEGATIITGPHIMWARMMAAFQVAQMDLRLNIKMPNTRNAWIILAIWIDEPIPRSRKQKMALYEMVAPCFPRLAKPLK